MVLRVSISVAPVPSTSRAYSAVRVAIPVSSWNRLSAVRSAVSSPRAGPSTRASVAPAAALVPSGVSASVAQPGAWKRMISSATSTPQTTTSWRVFITNRAVASSGIRKSVVMSPRPISSASQPAYIRSRSSLRGSSARMSRSSGRMGSPRLSPKYLREPICPVKRAPQRATALAA